MLPGSLLLPPPFLRSEPGDKARVFLPCIERGNEPGDDTIVGVLLLFLAMQGEPCSQLLLLWKAFQHSSYQLHHWFEHFTAGIRIIETISG